MQSVSSVCFLYFFNGLMLLLLGILLTDFTTGLRCFLELQSYSSKALEVISRSFLHRLTLRVGGGCSQQGQEFQLFYLPGKSTQWLVKLGLLSLPSHQYGHDRDWAPGRQRAAGHVTLAVNRGETVEDHEVARTSPSAEAG